jgi:hypothetical protein
MALHIATSGMTSGQRIAWNKFNKERLENDIDGNQDVASLANCGTPLFVWITERLYIGIR